MTRGLAPSPVALGSATGRWLVTATVLASGMAFLDATAVSVALPSIGRELGSSLSGLQWIVNGYTLALAALILLGGSLGDRYGRRRVFLIGVAWFAVASLVCFFFVTTVKKKLKYDDSLDVFGIHAIGGIVGAIGTGFVANPAWGGQGWIDFTVIPAVAGKYDMAAQVITQATGVGVTLLLSGGVSLILFLLLKYTIGLRPSVEVEQEGLDINAHGERAYNY